MSIELTGDRVRLRLPTDEDVPRVVEMRADPEHLRTAGPILPVPPGPAWVRGPWFDRAQDPSDAGLVGLVVTDRDDGRFLGTCGYQVASPVHRVAVLGIGLRRDEIGRGYGTDAVRTLVRFAFEQHGVTSVRLATIANNAAGLRAYAKAGFVPIGRLREHVWRDGRWWDVIEMACPAPDDGGGATPR